MPASCVGWRAPPTWSAGGGTSPLTAKTLRRSFDGPGGRAWHVVSAFATGELSLVLGQVTVQEKSNEIDAIPGVAAPARFERNPS